MEQLQWKLTGTRFTAFSLPSQFDPWSEMAGPFAPGNESSCELSLLGTLVPGTFPPLIQNIEHYYAICDLQPLDGSAIKGRAISLQRAKVPGSEMARKRMGQGAKGPRGERARLLLANSLLGANWPGSEKARYPGTLYTLSNCAFPMTLSGHQTTPFCTSIFVY